VSRDPSYRVTGLTSARSKRVSEHQILGAMPGLQAILTAACLVLVVQVLREVREISPVVKTSLDAVAELLRVKS